MDVRQIVGENVRRFRLEAGMTQEQVAEKMGVDRAYVSSLELGSRNPTIITLWHASLALGVELPDLLEQKPTSSKKGLS